MNPWKKNERMNEWMNEWVICAFYNSVVKFHEIFGLKYFIQYIFLISQFLKQVR